MNRLELRIRGMDCADEVAILRREVGPLVGGDDRLSFDILRARMTVDAPPTMSPDRLLEAIARTGMRGEVWTEDRTPSTGEGFWRQHGRTVAMAASGVFTLAAFVLHAADAGGTMAAIGTEGLGNSHHVPLTARLLYGGAVVAGGWFIAPKAWLSARRLRPDMNLLMTIAVIGAIAIGEWFEAATVAFLFALALTLESWSLGRARRAVASLMDMAPPVARVRTPDGTYREVAPPEVPVGSWMLVRPGERVPLDGVVRQGRSAINQAPITGESVPVEKDVGSPVYAGTINGDGAIEIESTKAAEETTLAHIIHLVSEAQSRRAPAEQWVERFARIYTPAILLLAGLVLLVPPLAFGATWTPWVYRALVLLVIGCPCALVISTPVTIVAALTAAAHNGVLIKGGLFVEMPARLRAIAFDKTGTLTVGHPAVTEIIPMNGHTAHDVLQRAASLEAHSDHPIARAIVAHGATADLQPSPVMDFQTVQGRGATGHLDGRRYWVGSRRYLEERGVDTPGIHDRLNALAQAGHTVVGLGDGAHLCGLIVLADPLRPNATRTVRALREEGIEHIVMLTGDNKATAATIARKTRVDEVRAELLPLDKVTTVEALVATYGSVAMVGDGVNDAPAMARATVGIAMGAAGSDAAIETADIALMSDDLSKLPWLIRHSRRALGIIRQNITLSLGVKALFVFLTFRGHASLWAAIAADMGVSLLVIANALRLLNAGEEGG
jgi:Cd2+/Zn2+-exporting ATPase